MHVHEIGTLCTVCITIVGVVAFSVAILWAKYFHNRLA
jgi:hypothetical protein